MRTALTGEAGDWVYLKDAVTYGGTAYPAGTVLKLNVDSDDGAGDITDWVIEEALSKAMTAASNEDDIRLYMAGNTSSTVWQYIGTGVNRFFTMFTAKDGATATQIANTDPNSVNGAIVWDWGGSNLLHHHNTELAALGYYSDTSVVWFLGAIYTAVAGGDHTQSPSTATDVNWKRHASGQFENAKNSAQTVDTTDVDRKLIVAHNLTAGTITAGSFGKVIEFVATVDMQVVAGAGVTLEFRASGGLNFEAHQSGALVATAANTWAVIGGNA